MRRVSLLLSLSVVAQATSFSANSSAGRKLLENSKQTKPHRRANDYNNYGYDNYDVYGDLSTQAIKYLGCSSYMTYDTETDGENPWANYDNANMNDDEEKWWGYQMQANEDGLISRNLVRFTLCDSEKCNGECSGEYVVDMPSFVQAYTEYKMNHDSFWCERIRENCACSNGNSWHECYSDCFAVKGLSYDDCRNAMQNGNQNVFDIQEYIGCAGIQFYNPQYMYSSAYNQGGSNFNYNNMYYLGLTCTSNEVMLTGFYDEQCSFHVDETELKNAMGSYNHNPYLEGTPVVAKATCVGCKDDVNKYGGNNNGYNNAQQNGYYEQQNAYNAYEWNQEWAPQTGATDLCMMMTGQDGGNAIVCDDYNRNGCDYIQDFLPKMDGRYNKYFSAIARMKNDLVNSKRATWALAALVAVLLGVLAFLIVARLTDEPEVPQNRDALLEYRRELEAAGTMDTSKEFL